jgi:hypothetical protein
MQIDLLTLDHYVQEMSFSGNNLFYVNVVFPNTITYAEALKFMITCKKPHEVSWHLPRSSFFGTVFR